MPTDNTHLDASGNAAKLPDGPIDGTKPGPTFETAVIDAVKDSMASEPKSVSNIVETPIVDI